MMKFGEKFRYQFLAGVMFILLVGCQSFQPSAPGELAIKEGILLDYGMLIIFCMVGRNIAQIQGNLTELKSAPRPISLNESLFLFQRLLNNGPAHEVHAWRLIPERWPHPAQFIWQKWLSTIKILRLPIES